MTGLNKILSAEKLVGKIKLEPEEHYIAELDGSVMLRGFTKDEQVRIRRTATKNGTKKVDDVILENEILKIGFHEPKLTDEIIEHMRSVFPAVSFDNLIVKITNLSGLKTKEAVTEMESQFLS